MMRRFGVPGWHPSPDALARFVSTGARDDRRILEHLAACPRCMGIYAEFVHSRAVDASGSFAEPVPAEWLRRGLAVASSRTEAATRVMARRPAPARRFAGLAGMAAAAALVAVVAVSGMNRASERSRQDLLADAMRRDSYGGLIYGESFVPIPSGYRGATPDPKVDAALAELARRNDGGPRSAEQAFWLVSGFLSKNELENADASLREARRRFAADDRLMSLAAILAYKRNDLPTAAGELEAALLRRRAASHLYNLARIRREMGDSTAAAALGQELRDRYPESPLASMTPRAPEMPKPGDAPAPPGSGYSRDSVPTQ